MKLAQLKFALLMLSIVQLVGCFDAIAEFFAAVAAESFLHTILHGITFMCIMDAKSRMGAWEVDIAEKIKRALHR